MEEVKSVARAMQILARHRMIVMLESDILADMQVCEIEGWNKMEYINQIGTLLDELRRRNNEMS